MITVTRVEGAKELRAFRRAAGLDEEMDCEAYQAIERGETIGYCLYQLEGERLTLLAVQEQGDAALGDGLLRTVLDYGRQAGASAAHMADSVDPVVLNRLDAAGYPYKTDNDIDNVLSNKSNCFVKAERRS